jgi:predicted phage-related endonuclease
MASQEIIPGLEAIAPRDPSDRRGFIGGSDVAAIFGLSPWQTPYDLWEQKTATEFVAPMIEPKREKMFRRGKRLEPWVVEMLEDERGIYVVRRNQIYYDAEFPWMRCEIDFEYMDDEHGICNGDIKTIFTVRGWRLGRRKHRRIPHLLRPAILSRADGHG